MEKSVRSQAGFEESSRFGKGFARLRLLFPVLGLVVLGAAWSGTASHAATGGQAASLPSFVFEPFYAANEGVVYGIYEARHADLVLVEGGFDSGFRTGMVCRVTDGGVEIGEVMLVEVRSNCAAALILQLEADRVVQPGHLVRIKTVKF